MLLASFIGNVGGDPEVRYSPKGVAITSFSVAINQVRFGPDGERSENTEWIRVRVAGRQSEYAQKLTKGSRVFVTGRMDITHFKSKDGEDRTGHDVWADQIQNAGTRPDTNGLTEQAEQPKPQQQAARPAPARQPVAAAVSDEPPELDDLPF